jgi:hypothetical protein
MYKISPKTGNNPERKILLENLSATAPPGSSKIKTEIAEIY